MGYFQVRYDSRVVIYNRRGFIRLATGLQFDFTTLIGTNNGIFSWPLVKLETSHSTVILPLIK